MSLIVSSILCKLRKIISTLHGYCMDLLIMHGVSRGSFNEVITTASFIPILLCGFFFFLLLPSSVLNDNFMDISPYI